MSEEARLREAGFARMWARARARLEREQDALHGGGIVLSSPTPAERDALGGLLGRRFTGKSLQVSLAELDAALLRGPAGRGLVAWLTRLGGPLRDRRAEADAERRAADAMLAALRESPLAAQPWYAAWVDALDGASATRLVRSDDAARLVRARALLEALPADDLPIALFASAHAGGTKALDDTPLDRLVLHALALREGVERPTSAEARRALWERVGVVPDDLASHVLVLGLIATGDGLVDRWLQGARAAGVPVRLTLHQLVQHPPTLAAATLSVCENPAVVRAAAERLGPRCAPLVATEGRASTAFWRLLRRHPGPVRVHADFDAAGLEIAGAVIARGARPWRFDAAAYRAACHAPNAALPARLPPTPWDPALADAMAGGVRVEEEQVVEALLADLDADGDLLA